MAIEKCSVFLCGMRAQPNTKLCIKHTATKVQVATDPPPVVYKITDLETPITMNFKTIDDYDADVEAQAKMMSQLQFMRQEFYQQMDLPPWMDTPLYMPPLWQDEGDQA